jgi:hypothetical protein
MRRGLALQHRHTDRANKLGKLIIAYSLFFKRGAKAPIFGIGTD